MLMQEAVNTAVQLALVLVILGIAYWIAGSRRGGFGQYTGLMLPTRKSMFWALGIALVIVPLMLSLFYFTPLREAAAGGNTVAGNLREHGFSGEIAAVILLVALVKTSLTEEIFFRGLLAKRLIRRLGFGIGNSVHAVIFGSVHLVIFIAPEGPEFTLTTAAAFLGVTAGGGWIQAWLNERVGNGSIAPGWVIHALANVTAYPLLAFG